MNSKCSKKTLLPAKLPAAGAIIMAVALLAPGLNAGPAPATEATAPEWKWGVSLDYMYREVDREEDYLSAPYDWHVKYDNLDGDLWGFTAFVTPPCFLNTMIDFSYRTGNLDGDFTNYSLDPRDRDFGNTYKGQASFDRDEFEAGLTYPFPNLDWLYARAEWFRYDEDGDWNYGGGSVEAQKYTLWGVSSGLGAKYGFPLGNTGARLDFNGFAGLVYFDFEHEEVGGAAKTHWNDWGFLGRAAARISYPILKRTDVFLGVGYEYLQTNDSRLDMTNQGLFANLGIKGEF